MTKTNLQQDKTIAELLDILKASQRSKELETMMALVNHVNAVEHRLETVLNELETVKQRLEPANVPEPVKQAHKGVVETMQKHIHQLQDKLAGIRNKIVQAAEKAVDNFKQTGKIGLDTVLKGLHIHESLERMEKSCQKSAQMADQSRQRLDNANLALRSTGTQIRNIGRALTGKELLSPRQENGRFANAVTAPLKTQLKVYHELSAMTHKAITKLERFSQDVQRGKGEKPSVKQALDQAKADQPALKPKAPDKNKEMSI